MVLLRGAVVLAALFAATTHGADEKDQIQKLPGWHAPLPSKQYSGFLDIGDSKHLHYWFVESERDPATDPVVLWLNGGPGCSSLDGYLYEHGPFHVNPKDHNQLYRNRWSWTRIANVIYLEAPAGVGFSYAEDKSQYVTNDDKTAADNLKAMDAFFQKFPEYREHDLYLTGESYAGIYVPTLAEEIMKATDNGQMQFNLKGFAVGNGCIGSEIGVCSPQGNKIRLEFCHMHAMFSDELYDKMTEVCKDWENPDARCMRLVDQALNETGPFDIYNIYGDCIIDEDRAHPLSSSVWSSSADPLVQIQGRTSSRAFRVPGVGPLSRAIPECKEDTAAADWLNRPDVREAIHVSQSPLGSWSVCTNQIHYTPNRKNLPKEIYPTLINRYRTLIFNGDVDACVPYIDNEKWTRDMGLDESETWRPWIVDHQVAGYVTTYKTNDSALPFTFLTVKGAGHMVPQVKPVQGYEMYKRFLEGKGY